MHEFQYYPLLQESQKYPTLTKEEEIELFTKFFETSDEAARKRIFDCNLKLVFFTITKYKLNPVNRAGMEDMIMELSNHLWTIIPKFDLAKKRRFNTFAVFCLKNKAITFLEKEDTYQKRFRGYLREEELEEVYGNVNNCRDGRYTIFFTFNSTTTSKVY